MAHSEIDAIRTLLGSKPRPVGWSERRQRINEVGSTWPVASDVKCETVDCDGVAGEWSIAPGSEPWRVLLYFHGGGYCSGSIVSHRRLVTEAGRAAGTRTLAIDYRLAPEHPYPAAHDDALTAWRFLRRQGIAAADIAVGGDSAGGNLTLGLIGRLRAAGEELPACAWLVSPWTDLTMSGSTLATKDAVGSADPQGLSRRACGCLRAAIHRSPRCADLAAVCQSGGLSAGPDSGWIGRDIAGGRDTTCRGGRESRYGCDATDLAAHDPCMAGLECESRRRPARAGGRRSVHPGAYPLAPGGHSCSPKP
jgi:alpha/beta hydrolase family protein